MITILYGGLFTGDPVWTRPWQRTIVYAVQDVICVAFTGIRYLTQCGTNAIEEEYKINPLIRFGEMLSNIGLCVFLTNLPVSLVGFIVGFASTLVVGLVFDALEKWQYSRYAKEECVISTLGILIRQAPTSLGAGLFVFVFRLPMLGFIRYLSLLGPIWMPIIDYFCNNKRLLPILIALCLAFTNTTSLNFLALSSMRLWIRILILFLAQLMHFVLTIILQRSDEL